MANACHPEPTCMGSSHVCFPSLHSHLSVEVPPPKNVYESVCLNLDRNFKRHGLVSISYLRRQQAIHRRRLNPIGAGRGRAKPCGWCLGPLMEKWRQRTMFGSANNSNYTTRKHQPLTVSCQSSCSPRVFFRRCPQQHQRQRCGAAGATAPVED